MLARKQANSTRNGDVVNMGSASGAMVFGFEDAGTVGLI